MSLQVYMRISVGRFRGSVTEDDEALRYVVIGSKQLLRTEVFYCDDLCLASKEMCRNTFGI